MSRCIGEASVLLLNYNSHQTDKEIHRKITCHVKTNESEKMYSDEKQFELHGL